MIYFTSDIQQDFPMWLHTQSFSQIFVLTDEHTAEHCYPILAKALQKFPHIHFSVKSGEIEKTLATCTQIWARMLEVHLDRKALFINLGGGVIGDMGGFCATTYKRGIRFVQVPTTLLAQVDASVGGKLGIDFGGYKNVIGTFQEPLAIWICADFLHTLPTRELRSGLAEIIKHELIQNPSERAFATYTLEPFALKPVIKASVAIKQNIVKQDIYETGLRKILNFGHTIGHAIESYFLLHKSAPLLHGEAVALGMLAEAYLSMHFAGLSEASYVHICTHISSYFPEKPVLAYPEIEAIAELAYQDKKNDQTHIQCVLLAEVGKAVFDVKITAQAITDALSKLFGT